MLRRSVEQNVLKSIFHNVYHRLSRRMNYVRKSRLLWPSFERREDIGGGGGGSFPPTITFTMFIFPLPKCEGVGERVGQCVHPQDSILGWTKHSFFHKEVVIFMHVRDVLS